MAASEEERKMNVDRAKRASLTTRSSLPLTIALSPRQQQHARTDDHPEVELLHEGETEEAEADGDVEDIVIEVPVQPANSASSRQQPPQRSSRAMHCAQPRLRHGRAH